MCSESLPSSGAAVDPRLPTQIVILGLISLLTAMSSAMILGLLPVFLATVLAVHMSSIGVIEGVAGAANSITRIFSGPLSDLLGRRKPLLLFGYGLSALVKVLFPLAETAATVFVARAVDRVGKGARDAPRDALLTDITPAALRGSGFGLRAALYTLGFVLGPLSAMGLMMASNNDFRLVFWIALVPAVAAIAILAVGVTEPPAAPGPARRPISRYDLSNLAKPFWWAVAIAVMFSLARFSEAFLILKAHAVGVEPAFTPLFTMLTYFVYSVVAYPCGKLADHVDRRLQAGAAGLILMTADLILAGADSIQTVIVGAALWGLQMGVSYGLLKAAVADAAPENLRGTAFGIYDFSIGLATFVASVLAGLCWSIGGPSLTFEIGAGLAAAALVMVLIWPGSALRQSPTPAALNRAIASRAIPTGEDRPN